MEMSQQMDPESVNLKKFNISKKCLKSSRSLFFLVRKLGDKKIATPKNASKIYDIGK